MKFFIYNLNSLITQLFENKYNVFTLVLSYKDIYIIIHIINRFIQNFQQMDFLVFSLLLIHFHLENYL